MQGKHEWFSTVVFIIYFTMAMCSRTMLMIATTFTNLIKKSKIQSQLKKTLSFIKMSPRKKKVFDRELQLTRKAFTSL